MNGLLRFSVWFSLRTVDFLPVGNFQTENCLQFFLKPKDARETVLIDNVTSPHIQGGGTSSQV